MRRAAGAAGHYGWLLIWVLVAGGIAGDAAGEPGGGAGWILTAVAAAGVAGMLIDARHQERLCERCVAAVPLDPGAAVRRWIRVLRWRHSRWSTVALALMLAVILGNAALFGRLPREPWPALAVHSLAFPVLGFQVVAVQAHRRLSPWCPWCRWGDGGPREPSPDIPVPSASK